MKEKLKKLTLQLKFKYSKRHVNIQNTQKATQINKEKINSLIGKMEEILV